MKRLIILVFLTLLTSCSVNRNGQFGSEARIKAKVFQTLSKYEALASTSDYNVVKVISLDDVFFDGREIKGRYILIDTYSYETINKQIKTVPVYILKSEYQKWKKTINTIMSE